MKINGYTKEFIKVVTYRVEDVPDVGTVMYSDYYDDNDRIVDSILRTEEGYDIDVPSVMEIVQDFISTEMTTSLNS